MSKILEAVFETALDLYQIDLMSEDKFDEFVNLCHKEKSEKMTDNITSLIDNSLIIECIDDAYLDRGDWRPIIEELVCSVLEECIDILDDQSSINVIKTHFNLPK